MGGAQASFWSVDRDYTQSSIDTITKGKWKKYKSVKGFFKLFAVLGEYTELATRVGYYKKARKALAAFSNASIQGWDKFFRTFDLRQLNSKDKETRQQCLWAWFRLAIGSILPTLFCFLWNTSGDDDWYEKDLPDWERQTHWCLGENIRIPKGQDVALRFFSNLTESILRSMAGDKKAFEHWTKPLYDSLPDFMPTAIQPIIECATNYDMFRKTAIVPYHQQRLPENMQYDSRTSALAKFISDISGWSPMKIDHFIYGYTGKLGKDFVRLGQNVLGKIFGKDEWVDYNSFTDLPIINGIKSGFIRMPYTNPRTLTEFYEKLDEQTKLHNEFKMTKQRPEGYDHNLYTRLKKTSDEMKKLTKREREIIDNPNLDFDVRDERQKALQKRRVDMAERALR